MLGTKILGGVWFICVAAMPVVDRIPCASNGEELATGNAQQVLAIVILGLSAAFVWLARRREKDLQDEKKDWRDWMRRERERSDKVAEALSENSKALQSTATSHKGLQQASYHLAEVIRQCKGNDYDRKEPT